MSTAETVAWMAKAACRDTDLNQFFTDDQETAVLRLCLGCPVRPQCLAWARANEDVGYEHGYWGGTTATTRHRLRQKPRRRAACPTCRSPLMANVGVFQLCLGCGLSWATVAAAYRLAAKTEVG